MRVSYAGFYVLEFLAAHINTYPDEFGRIIDHFKGIHLNIVSLQPVYATCCKGITRQRGDDDDKNTDE